MSGDDQRSERAHDDESGLVESDDTTQADAGMAGGTGAAPGEATVQPLGTEPHDGDGDGEEQGEQRV